MYKKVILYEFFLYWQLSQVINVYCDSQSKKFKKYLINSLNHIRVQNGWDLIQETEIKLEHFTINTISITSEIIDETNFIQKLYFITCLLNCEFTNILQTFNAMLGLILNKCEVTVLNNQCTELKYCTNLIINIFKCSVNMFQNMLKTAKYLDKIDLRIIDSHTFNIKTVDSEINFFYTHALELINDSLVNLYSIERWVNIYENIKDFNRKAELVTTNLYKIRKVCGAEYKSSILINLIMKYNIDQMEKLVEDSYDYINDIYKDLELYILDRTENCYSKLGFEQLIGTNTFKYIYFKSKNYSNNEGIDLCNHLLSYAGWMSWKHIAVETEFTKGIPLYFKDILQIVDMNNYNFMRSYLALILRCRYIEILRNFNVMLEHIINACKYENKINCAIKLYETLMLSDDMFRKMLFALITLRHYTIDKQYMRQELLIEKLVEIFIEFLNDVRKKYFSTLLFINGGLYEAQSFLEDLAQVHTSVLLRKFYDVNQYNMKYCKIIEYEIDIITTFEQLIKTNTLTEYSIFHHFMCDYLESFFLKVVKNDYDYLGFNDLSLYFD
ncbi:uncharacterized protein LOC126901517 isoform X2 [Daktulosphaira vitifoliae]|uniref:uncharacterized protein LOC126901517 isoform X2 n=1 Tax=Daktulosphaira vitifoliae TaxID=58002 RepID=UPI0021AA2884|nr:uncharacterized protein LOC126901517 isoform X2 [Daktulosphaira vitifoliae]